MDQRQLASVGPRTNCRAVWGVSDYKSQTIVVYESEDKKQVVEGSRRYYVENVAPVFRWSMVRGMVVQSKRQYYLEKEMKSHL